jgi:thiamine biosynthesis lipoprotein
VNEVRFEAIGTTVHLLVDRHSALAGAESALREFLADLDRACSRFRPDSALSRLNRHGGPMAVDPLLLAAIRVAVRAAELTGGLVDPTLGVSIEALGYDRDFAGVPARSPEPFEPVAGGHSWREIRVAGSTVTLPAGVRLDLGATCKAWAADVAARQLAAGFGCAVLVNLGGDIAVAGRPAKDIAVAGRPVGDIAVAERPAGGLAVAGRPASGDIEAGHRAGGWRVRLAEDCAGGDRSGPVVTIRSGGLATSSTVVRRWQRAGVPLHHVLDPATGLPSLPCWRYVSVAAASCLDANTAATAAVVLGAKAPAWLAERGLPARLVAVDGRVTRTAGWPEPLVAASPAVNMAASPVVDMAGSPVVDMAGSPPVDMAGSPVAVERGGGVVEEPGWRVA